jgi:DNA-binding MarR family transcriptional regulator
LTAISGNSGDRRVDHERAGRATGDGASHVERTFRSAIVGRRAARAIAEWARQFELSEAEVQLLWRLRTATDDPIDQTALAKSSAFSAAQISASVERLRTRGWVTSRSAHGDRRRHQWQLSAAGLELVAQLAAAAAGLLGYDAAGDEAPTSDGDRRRRAAA